MPTMEMINDRLPRQQSISWTTSAREEFGVMGANHQVRRFHFRRFRCRRRLICCDGAVTGNGLYIMDAMLVYLIVDFFFGGKVQTHVKPEGPNLHRFRSG